MSTPPEGTPWWAWLLGVLLVVGGSAFSAWLSTRPLKKALRQVAEDTAATRIQAENEHADAEFPNLRDEVTAIRNTLANVETGQRAIRDNMGGLQSESRDLRKDVAGIRTDARHDRRRLAEQEKAIDDHLQDVPRILDEAFAKHVDHCPARTPGQQ